MPPPAGPPPAIDTMNPLPTDWLRPLGGTGLTVSMVCAGGGPLGSMPGNFGYDVPESRGVETALRVLRGPITFLDTSNNYSGGDSERRIGTAPAPVLAAAIAMQTECASHGVPLAAVATQFSTRDPRIASTILGFSRPERVDEAVQQATWPTPEELWARLEQHVPAREHWLY